MCLIKELHFPLLVSPLHCSHQVQQKSQNCVCESPEPSVSKKTLTDLLQRHRRSGVEAPRYVLRSETFDLMSLAGMVGMFNL